MSINSNENKAEQLFFNIEDSTKIKTFIQIPKALFVNPIFKKLPLSCKLAYSIYLQRYSITTYKDEIGPYIIFPDKEVGQLIDVSEEYVRKIRKKLEQAGLISYKKSVSYNKIYVYSYAKENLEDKVFYYESDIDNLKFYRYPTEFFEDKYDNLPIEAKFIYSIYYDTMCLSKANYFTDNKERIYFQESAVDQELKSNFSDKTLKKYREYLKACNLLYEHKPFGQSIRYYLIKLNMFEDNVFVYQHLPDSEKPVFVQSKMSAIKKKYIDIAEGLDIAFIKKGIKSLKLTRENVTQLIYEHTGNMISTSGLKKYLNETRKMPDEIYSFLCSYIKENTDIKSGPTIPEIEPVHISNKDTVHNGNKNMFVSEEKDELLSEIISEGIGKNFGYINNTITDMNKTDIKDTLLKECFNKINSINELIKEDKEFLKDVFVYISSQNFIETKKKIYQVDDLEKLMQYFIQNSKNISISLLNRLYSGSHNFYTPESVIRYFVTMLINDYEVQQTTPGWFQNGTLFSVDEYRSRVKERYPQREDIFETVPFTSNYNWWDED